MGQNNPEPQVISDGIEEAKRRIAKVKDTKATELDLGGLQLTDIPEELYELTWLTHLYLGGNQEARETPHYGAYYIDKKQCNALHALPDALCETLSHLQHLDLNYNTIVIPKNITSLSQLTSLDLSGNSIGTVGAKALASLSQLTSLDLAHNGIQDDGAKALARLSQLTSLDLAHNGIQDDGAKALARLSQLTSLNLAHNGSRMTAPRRWPACPI